ncbi:unnamed protein product [Kluyveromyces dobzhanskii CBS 2104]|uniref:WGS project CCBQ000000000 data, contig 00058 n=1 Tax=Kluyveromyces dobzhanskii CBS 2104 TaxID=1427455 RepID=A0A0A8LBW8_9SACH|nr:unnamed protein product [Kluyveromyces dobzhanskii CBS 2104]
MFLLLSIAYLLPLDVFYAAQSFDNGSLNPINGTLAVEVDISRQFSNIENQPNFHFLWTFLYWSQFAICWFILPVLISYVDLKYLYPHDESDACNNIMRRIRTAIYMNLKFYVFCAIAVVIGLVYLLAATNHGLNEAKSLVIAMSHLYSLSYTLILLSNGLVNLPKALLFQIHDHKKLFVKLSQNNEDLNEAKLSLLEVAEKVLSLKVENEPDLTLQQSVQECQMEVQRLCNELTLTVPVLQTISRGHTLSLLKLNDYYNTFMTEYYNYTYHQAKSDEVIHTLVRSQRKAVSVPINVAVKIAGTLLAFMSVLVLLLQITPIRFGHAWIFMGTTIWHFFLEMAILLHSTICSLYSLLHVKIHNFHLVSNGNSSPKNALYFSLYSSRLLFPLCFNYMILIPRDTDVQHQSSFDKVLYHQLEKVALAKYLNEYLPVFFVLIVPIAQYFDLKEKILSKVLGQEYYYQLFGSIGTDERPLATSTAQGSRLDEDYEYSLQDGQYLFERATSHYNMNG